MLTNAANTGKHLLPQLAAKETVTTKRYQQSWTLERGPKMLPTMTALLCSVYTKVLDAVFFHLARVTSTAQMDAPNEHGCDL